MILEMPHSQTPTKTIRPFYVELFDTGQTVVPRRTDIRAFRNLVPRG